MKDAMSVVLEFFPLHHKSYIRRATLLVLLHLNMLEIENRLYQYFKANETFIKIRLL